MNKLLTECIGTFFLVFAIGLTGNPLAIGAMLMVMIYMGGHVSGAHYNPAVTIAVFMRGKLAANLVAPYMIAQILGAILAAVTVSFLTGKSFAPAPGALATMGQAYLAEILCTFALALVILHVATSDDTAGNSHYGLAIGFTVFASATAVGSISGGAFNPAVGIGPILVNAISHGGGLDNLLLYIVGPLAGGALAALVYRTQTS